MIFIGLLVIGLLFWAFCSFWGFLLGTVGTWMSEKYKSGELPQRGTKYAEPPSHVNLLTPPAPYDWETDLDGWDGAEELDVDEEI